MKRHLLYHVTPMANYRWNIYQLQKRIHLFNGRLFVAVAQGKGLDPIEKVKKLFPANVEMFPVANDRELRETVSFLPLLERAQQLPPGDTTFYAHTKGVTRGNDPAVKLWTQALHYFNLDCIQQVEQLFKHKQSSIIGSLVRHGLFESFPKESLWHYSGTFFWFHNEKVFAKPKWGKVPKMKYGVEAWPALLFKFRTEAGCVYGPGITDLYNFAYLNKFLGPNLVQQIRAKSA